MFNCYFSFIPTAIICGLNVSHLFAWSRYIAKTLYGDEEEVETPQTQNVVEEPKLLGHNPVSNEKVEFISL